MKIFTKYVFCLLNLGFVTLQAQNQMPVKVIENGNCYETIAETLWDLPPQKFLVINPKFHVQVLQELAKLQGTCLSQNAIGGYRRIMQVSRALIYHCDKRLSDAGYSLLEYTKMILGENRNQIQQGLDKLLCEVSKEAPLLLNGGDFCLNAPIFNGGNLGNSSLVVNVDRFSVTVRGGFGTLYQSQNITK
jgi:hypothetical protein